MTGRVIFRVDGSLSIGGGHVMRCLTLARELGRRGWACSFLCDEDTVTTVPALVASAIPVVASSRKALDDPQEAGRLSGSCELLVVDHYGLDARWETPMRQWARRVLVLDDLADRSHDCDILLDQNAGRAPSDYAGLVPSGSTLLIGPDFALLRSEFQDLRAASLSRRRVQPARRVLISLGLTDPGNLTCQVLDGLAAAPVVAELDVVLGSSAPFLAMVRDKVAGMPSASLAVDVPDMAERMAAADLAVGAGGSSSWERCCLGLPTIVIIAADNQRVAARALAATGAVMLFEGAVDQHTVASCVRTLLIENALRLRMAAAAAAICDGLGARKCFERDWCLMTRVLLLSPYPDKLFSSLQDAEVEVFNDRVSIEMLTQRRPHWIVSYGYRYIVNQAVIDSFPGRIINLHISLLPWNRGADPNFWSFFDQTPKGVSIHAIDKGIDTGDILAQEEVFLGNDGTLETTYNCLHHNIVALFERMWPLIKAGGCHPQPQNGAGTSHLRKDLDPLRPLLPLGWKTPVNDVITLGQRLRRDVDSGYNY